MVVYCPFDEGMLLLGDRDDFLDARGGNGSKQSRLMDAFPCLFWKCSRGNVNYGCGSIRWPGVLV